MARMSPIIVGSVAVAGVLIAVEVYLVLRPHRPKEAVIAPQAPPPEVPSPAPPAPRGGSGLPRMPGPMQAPPPAAEEGTPAGDGQGVSEIAAKRAGSLTRAAHNQRLRQVADEHLFEKLKLPEDKRAAIRRFNEEYEKKKVAIIEAIPDRQRSEQEINENFQRYETIRKERVAAIRGLLGPEGARAFESGELSSMRFARRLELKEKERAQNPDGGQASGGFQVPAVPPPAPAPP